MRRGEDLLEGREKGGENPRRREKRRWTKNGEEPDDEKQRKIKTHCPPLCSARARRSRATLLPFIHLSQQHIGGVHPSLLTR